MDGLRRDASDEARAGQSPSCRSRRGHSTRTPIAIPVGWPTGPRCPSTGVPGLGTVLANEEIIDGKSERGGFPVVRMPLTQWMLRITAYAERLVDDLEDLDWPAPIKEMQRNWVGRSEGRRGRFLHRWPALATDARRAAPWSDADPDVIRVYTTRPDTLFGATYMVLAPEHPLVDRLTILSIAEAVSAYRAAALGKSDLDRTDLAKTKTGVFTGGYAINPVNGSDDSHLDRRLCPDGLRHRRDHGRTGSRRARLRVRRRNSTCRSPGRRNEPRGPGESLLDTSRSCEPGIAVNSRNDAISLDGLPTAEAKRAITELADGAWTRQEDR